MILYRNVSIWKCLDLLGLIQNHLSTMYHEMNNIQPLAHTHLLPHDVLKYGLSTLHGWICTYHANCILANIKLDQKRIGFLSH